jgi:hypothetical protein
VLRRLERHLGRFDDDGVRVDYTLKFPPGRKIFWSRRQDSAECVSAISTCPWCGADLSPFPTPTILSGRPPSSPLPVSAFGRLRGPGGASPVTDNNPVRPQWTEGVDKPYEGWSPTWRLINSAIN